MASREVARVAGAAEDLKLRKYASLSSSYVFYPILYALRHWESAGESQQRQEIHKMGACVVRTRETTEQPLF